MATRPRKKTSAAGVRRSVPGRKQQVERLNHQTIQALKAAFALVQTTLDLNGNSGPQWIGGSLWADIYTRSGTFIGTIHYALPKQFLSTVGVHDVRLEPKGGRFFRSGGEDQPVNLTVERGRVSSDARVSVSQHPGDAAGESFSAISGRRGAVHNRNGGR